MSEARLIAFENPARHRAASELIRRHSCNRSDVRRVALEGLDLGATHLVLDLGCGFGFLAQEVAPRLAPDARIVGVDACKRNRRPFLECVNRCGREAEFHELTLGRVLPFPGDRFDLVLASYSLYFFPTLLPEIVRVLESHGLFLTITHAERSCRSLLELVGCGESAARLLEVIGGFSAENGRALLARFFDVVERLDYENSLQFDADELEELLDFLCFKMPSLAEESEVAASSPNHLEEVARQLLSRSSPVTVEKNDTIFRCWRPRRS